MAPLKRKPLLGLALGGGGARGLAHIGILKVLESEGISPDVLSGTSMGGIIAALFASGLHAREIEKQAREISKLSAVVKLVDSNITSLEHIFGVEGIQKYFTEMLGTSLNFSELQIPLAMAAVDILSAKEVVLQEGNLIQAINATMALPGIMEPVKWGDMLLMDGGALNNVPADLVRSMGAEVVIAVDVSPDVTDPRYWEQQRMPDMAKASLRWDRIIGATITEAKLRKAAADLVLRPNISPQVSTLSGFKYAESVMDAGSRAALDAMPAIRKLLGKGFYFSAPKIRRAEPYPLG
jgi:NTE family protein